MSRSGNLDNQYLPQTTIVSRRLTRKRTMRSINGSIHPCRKISAIWPNANWKSGT